MTIMKSHKSLYGLKQSARARNKTANNTLEQLGFKMENADSCLYSRNEQNGHTTYILLYVDDLLIAGSSPGVTCLLLKN